MNVTRRLVASTAAKTLLVGALMNAPNANAVTIEEQLKELKDQFSLLQQKIQLSDLQATQSASTNALILAALKGQVTAQSDLDKAKAQGQFATLSGIKAGLDSVGAPLGKDGKITVTTGTAGALMLSLKEPMLKGLVEASGKIATKVKQFSSTGVYIGTDAQVQSALQAVITKDSLTQAAVSLSTAIEDIAKAGFKPPLSGAFVAEAAAAGLFLNTLVGLEKFFRVDTSYTVFDAGEEAQMTLISMLERKLKDESVAYCHLSAIDIEKVQKFAKEAQESLSGLKSVSDAGSALLANIEKLKIDDPKLPAKNLVDRLKADLATVKSLIDTLHPASKPEGFWIYVQGLVSNDMMQKSGKYLNRLVVNAKAQTIQIVESRTWRSDNIYGKSDIQVEYRLLSPNGTLLDSGLMLSTFSAGETHGTATFNFPDK